MFRVAYRALCLGFGDRSRTGGLGLHDIRDWGMRLRVNGV